jgi:Pyridoxamine 5'-phosphate oxidase
MGKVYAVIDDRLKSFIEAQHVFFVGTAPAGSAGHVNVSPKALESLRILDPKTVAYIDYVGSGVETIAHLRENRRIVIMLCAFDGSPKIIRLHGEGSVIEPQDDAFGSMLSWFVPRFGVRSIIRVELKRISDSCGYGVPLYRYEGQRAQLADWAEHKGQDGLLDYQCEKNAASIDGLPGLRWPAQDVSV